MNPNEERQQIVEYRKKVFAAKNETHMQVLVQLLGLHVEKVKVDLLRCTPEALAGLQGEAVAYNNVLRWLQQPVEVSQQLKK